MIIDGKNLILGRMAAYAAKKALLGEEVIIVNCKDVMVTGDKYAILAHYKQKKERGVPRKGPFFIRTSEWLVRRTIRGMLPFKRERGRAAVKKIKCYAGVPEELKEKEKHTLKQFDVSKVPNLKYIRLGEIIKFLGGKVE